MTRNVFWPDQVIQKLTSFRSIHYTSEETFEFISRLVRDIDDMLASKVLVKSYREEKGTYEGYSRVVIRRFRIYFRNEDEDIQIVAILFPGEK